MLLEERENEVLKWGEVVFIVAADVSSLLDQLVDIFRYEYFKMFIIVRRKKKGGRVL